MYPGIRYWDMNMKLARIIGWLVLAYTPAAAQIITTVAGAGWLFPGDGRPAVDAPLNRARGLAVDRDGNLYLADPENNMVMKIGPDGILHVIAGNGTSSANGDGGPAISAGIYYP